MKRFLSFILAVVLCFGLGATVFAEADDLLPVVDDGVRDGLKEKYDELKEIRENIRLQNEVMKEKVEVIRSLNEEARRNKDWDALKTIREYRRNNIDIRIEKLGLRKRSLDIMDLLDEARESRNPELALEALDQLIALGYQVVALNGRQIENMDACIEELQ